MESYEATLSPNYPFPAFPTSSDSLTWQTANALCCSASETTTSTLPPSNQLQIATYDNVYPYPCAQPYSTIAPSVLPPSPIDIFLQLSPSPTSCCPSITIPGEKQIDTKLGKQPRSRPNASNKPYSKTLIRRTTSPVFPSHSIPVSTIGRRPISPFSMSSSLGRTTDITQLPNPAYTTEKEHSFVPISPMCIRLHHPYLQQLEDIDKKILKLNAERGNLLKLAHEKSYLAVPLKSNSTKREKGIVNLSLSSVDQLRIIENGLVEDANMLFLNIGGLHSSLEAAIEKFISLCSSGQSSVTTITDCFPYIHSLLPQEMRLKLQELPGTKFVQVEYCSSSPSPTTMPTTQSTSLSSLQVALDAVNEMIQYAQLMQHHSTVFDSRLISLYNRVQEIFDSLDQVCFDSSMERRGNMRAVIEGNLSVLLAVQQIWQQCCQKGMETLSCITESLILHN